MKFEAMPQGAILLVDKAEGWTSHDVVAKTRRALGTRKVGHAGTLDPMATGLLVLGAGPATRLLTYLVGLDKTYTTTMRLGATTVTDDREGDVTAVADAAAVRAVLADKALIAEGVAKLTGPIEQAPSSVSAIKVDGRRAYDRVRAGEEVVLKKRPVTIHAFELGEVREAREAESEDGATFIDIDATVRCSTGTYIRALARDLGADLGIGGHLTALRRSEVGPFNVADATPHAQLVGDADTPGDAGTLHAPADIARILFPVLTLTDEEAVDLANGKRLSIDSGRVDSERADSGGVDPERRTASPIIAAILPGTGDAPDRLVGLIEIKGGRTRVVMNFPTNENGPAK